MPLQRRLPKFGFKNINRVEYQPVNLSTLQALADKGVTTIGVAELKANRVIKGDVLVKILANGTLTAKVDVTAHAFSAAAETAIQNAGGTVTKL